MRGLQMPSPSKPKSKFIPRYKCDPQSPCQLFQQLPNASSRSYSVKLPPSCRQPLQRESSQVESIKAAIHKLRTQLPQFSELGFMHTRSKSYFFQSPTKMANRQKKFYDMKLQKHLKHQQNEHSYLPVITGQEYSHTSVQLSNKNTHQWQDCNVVLLKRNMRYRLQKLPLFDKIPPVPSPQLNLSLTGWHRNPEEVDDLIANS